MQQPPAANGGAADDASLQAVLQEALAANREYAATFDKPMGLGVRRKVARMRVNARAHAWQLACLLERCCCSMKAR